MYTTMGSWALSPVLCDDLEEWDGGRFEGRLKKEGQIYIHICS